jgi:hypothetical protein
VDEKVDCKNGINYITIGDGGNREQFAYPWVAEQPDWSAIREFAYVALRFQQAPSVS